MRCFQTARWPLGTVFVRGVSRREHDPERRAQRRARRVRVDERWRLKRRQASRTSLTRYNEGVAEIQRLCLLSF